MVQSNDVQFRQQQKRVVFYREQSGRVPVLRWLESLPAQHQTKCLSLIRRLGSEDDRLQFPHTRHLSDGIHELRVITDAVEIMDLLFIKGRPEMMAMLAEDEIQLEIAQVVYDLRQWTSLTQAQFAEKVGVQESVIEDLEESAYEGNSFGILTHIAEVLGRDLELRIITVLPEKYVEPEQQQELAVQSSRQPVESDSIHVGD